MENRVLILTNQKDISSGNVMQWLDYYGAKVIRVNGDDERHVFIKADATGVFFEDTWTNETLNLLDFSACWWRRTGIGIGQLGQYFSVEAINKGSIDYEKLLHVVLPKSIQNEKKVLQSYIYNRSYSTIPLNLGSPIFDLNRLVVLEEARKIGFKTPDYRVVTKLEDLIDFQKKYRRIIAKSIGNGIYDYVGNHRYYTYTELLSEDIFPTQESFQPSLVMSLIEKDFEIRTFYIAGYFYSMAVFSQSSENTKVDYRKGKGIVCVPFNLPTHISCILKKLYKRLKLNTGSADLIVDKQGNYVFLEINPIGQYEMTSKPCNYNLNKLIAKYLINGKIG